MFFAKKGSEGKSSRVNKMSNQNIWLENEVKIHATKINTLEQFANETNINVIKLIEQQKSSRESLNDIEKTVAKLDQAEIRRDERVRLWKVFLSIFAVGVFLGIIINDIHLIKVIFGR